MNRYLKILEKLCERAYKNDEVPVAALITYNGKVIAKAYNKRNKSNSVLDHAEVLVIKKACKKIKSWRLNKCDLYVTMYPCDMCKSIINETRIKNVYYIFENDKKVNYKTSYQQLKIQDNLKYKNLLTTFFKNKRYKS